MPVNRNLFNAYRTRDIPISEFLEKSKNLDQAKGAEKTALQEKLAKEIEETYPLRKTEE